MRMIGVLAALAAFFVPSVAEAGMARCGDRDQMVEQLKRQYQEFRTAAGVTQGGSLVELFMSSDGRTWTLLSSKPPLPTCIIGAGHGWKEFKQAVEGEES